MDIREMILEKIEYNEDFTLIGETEKMLELMNEHLKEGEIGYYEDEIEYCDIIAISLVDGEFYVENAFYDYDYDYDFKYMESDMFLLDKEIVYEIDIDKLEGNIMIFDIELEDIYSKILVNDDEYIKISSVTYGDNENHISSVVAKLNNDNTINRSEVTMTKDEIIIKNGTLKINDECECYENGFISGYEYALKTAKEEILETISELLSR